MSAAAGGLVRRRYEDPRELTAFSELRERVGLHDVEEELLARCFPPGARLLDLGAGAGREALGAARCGYEIVAVDFVRGMLEAGRRAGGAGVLPIRWLQGDAARLPFASGAFAGGLLVAQLLEHFHGRAVRVALLREAARVVRPGGHLLVSVHNGLWRPGVRHWLRRYAERRHGGELPRGGSTWVRRMVRAQSVVRAEDVRDLGRLGAQRARFEATTVARCVARALGRPALETGDGFTAQVSHAGPSDVRMPFHPYRPGELARDVRDAGLQIVAERPFPPPPPGRLGALAARGADFWYAAVQVP